MSSAPVVLREWLAEMKAAGVPFGQAWSLALPRVVRAYPDAEQLLAILDGQRETWRRAYNDVRPTDAENALAMIAAATLGDGDDLRRCEREGCETVIEGRSEQTLYCSDHCRKAVGHERERIARQRDAPPSALRGAPSGAVGASP
jgi:hypothetical protein